MFPCELTGPRSRPWLCSLLQRVSRPVHSHGNSRLEFCMFCSVRQVCRCHRRPAMMRPRLRLCAPAVHRARHCHRLPHSATRAVGNTDHHSSLLCPADHLAIHIAEDLKPRQPASNPKSCCFISLLSAGTVAPSSAAESRRSRVARRAQAFMLSCTRLCIRCSSDSHRPEAAQTILLFRRVESPVGIRHHRAFKSLAIFPTLLAPPKKVLLLSRQTL